MNLYLHKFAHCPALSLRGVGVLLGREDQGGLTPQLFRVVVLASPFAAAFGAFAGSMDRRGSHRRRAQSRSSSSRCSSRRWGKFSISRASTLSAATGAAQLGHSALSGPACRPRVSSVTR